ncbi:hypothetical protein P4I85_14470 [Bacillus cereus]|uniref:hypothetical protein n=1 Tax=Bacillus thuringiensis TaxID=1428 RepID=UPI001298B2D2|nr:hypothetical protein [Bacillus thuringiensis]MEB9509599.1 hypothetical protein [Bacillus cereus]MEB9561691.1 hypothetical protein [Bacillus cereus]MRC03009.1 hypothetical protein [Bacillus thuringiensis]
MPYIETIMKPVNGMSGIMFSITAKKDIFVTGLWSVFRGEGNNSIDIHIRDGGFINSSSGWTKIKSGILTNVERNSLIKIPTSLKVNIKSGETKGFAIVGTNINVGYSNGSTSYDNDDVILKNGIGFGGFGGSGYNIGRIFIGRVDYELDNDPPTQPGEITGIQETLYLTSESIQLDWGASTSQIGAPITYDIDIYDGSAWLSVATSVSDISISVIIPRHINTDNAKIRVQAKDTVGNKSPYKESQDFSIYDKMLLIRDGETVKSYKNGMWKTI